MPDGPFLGFWTALMETAWQMDAQYADALPAFAKLLKTYIDSGKLAKKP